MCYIKSYEDLLNYYLIEIVDKVKKAYVNIEALSYCDRANKKLDKMKKRECSKRSGSELRTS